MNDEPSIGDCQSPSAQSIREQLGLPVVKDSGSRENFATGSRRDTRDGKGRFDLLPARAIRRLARHFEAGSAKYGDRNWEKGQPISRYADSGIRHAFDFLEGKQDEDHLAAAVWNFLCLMDTQERIASGVLPQSLADLPVAGVQEKMAAMGYLKTKTVLPPSPLVVAEAKRGDPPSPGSVFVDHNAMGYCTCDTCEVYRSAGKMVQATTGGMV